RRGRSCELAELVGGCGGPEPRGGTDDPLSGARPLLREDLRVGLEDRPEESADPRQEGDHRTGDRGQGQLRRGQGRRLRGGLGAALTPKAAASARPARSASDSGPYRARATRPSAARPCAAGAPPADWRLGGSESPWRSTRVSRTSSAPSAPRAL